MLEQLPMVQTPILVTVGSQEGAGPQARDWRSFGRLAEQAAEISETSPNVAFQLIEGADHQYQGCVGQLWQVARGWLERLAAPSPG